VNHRLVREADDLLPKRYTPARTRPRIAHLVAVAGGLVLAGGAAYGVVPGELGQTGAQVVNVSAPPDVTPEQVLADSYLPASAHRAGATGTAIHTGVTGLNAAVVYVNGATQSDGTSIVSVAFPTPTESVLATRGNDGTCTFLRSDSIHAQITSTGTDSACKADAAPKRGWAAFFLSRYGSNR
jgi:hypothetical protein